MAAAWAQGTAVAGGACPLKATWEPRHMSRAAPALGHCKAESAKREQQADGERTLLLPSVCP